MFGDRAHFDHVMVRAESNSQFIADLQLLRPLRALSVHLDLARLDCLHRECPRFEKPRGPQPFIESDSRYIVGTHA